MQKKSLLTVYLDENLSTYGFGQGHPFNAERFTAFSKAFLALGLDPFVRLGSGTSCSLEDLQRFHDPLYINFVRLQSQEGKGYLDYGDTPAVRGIYEAACYVVGTALTALDEVMTGKTDQAFIPIGGLHHAKPKSAAGFCVFNDVGVLIQKAFEVYGLTSVYYVDIDAHFGDGVYYSFEREPRLHTFDWHQEYIFPGSGFANETGEGPSKGLKRNIPLKKGTTDKDLESFWQELEQRIQEALPQLILLQAGADSLKADPLAGLSLTTATHYRMASTLKAAVDKLGHQRLIVLGGGGYNLTNIAEGWCATVKGLLGL